MNRFTDTPRTAERAQSDAKAKLASAVGETGQRLADAQSADRVWREQLALRLHWRLRRLQQFDRRIQQIGTGIGAFLLLAEVPLFFGFPFGAASDAVLSGMLFAAVGISLGSLAAVAAIAACRKLTQRWILRLGLTEALEPIEETVSTARPQARPPRSPTIGWVVAAWMLIHFVLIPFIHALFSVFAHTGP